MSTTITYTSDGFDSSKNWLKQKYASRQDERYSTSKEYHLVLLSQHSIQRTLEKKMKDDKLSVAKLP